MEPFRSSLLAGLSLLFLGALLLVTVRGQTTTQPFQESTQPIPTTSPPPQPVSTTGIPTECPALLQYAQSHSDCETFGNCSGALCHLQQFLENSNATFLVEEKCADPVMVEMNIDGPSPLNGYRGRFSVGGDGLRNTSNDTNPVIAEYGRNASHLHYSAMVLIGGDQAMRLIPPLTLPLFPGMCMCQSMQQIADVVDRAPIGFFFVSIEKTCSARSDCQGVNCNITIPSIGNFVADIMVDPCGETVTFTAFDASDDRSEFRRVFHDSGEYPFNIGNIGVRGSLIVGMVHHNYSMDLSVKLQTTAGLPVEDILPSHKIILDRSNCSNLTYYYNNGTGEPTITTAPPTQPPHCPFSYIGDKESTNCDLSMNCSAVSCPAQSGRWPEASFAVKKICADPLTVDFHVGGQVSTRYIVSSDGLRSMESVNGENVKVEYGRNTTYFHLKAGASSSVLIPMVQIPLYPRSCMCNSMDNIVESTNMNSLPAPVGNVLTRTCFRRPDCDGIDCVISIQGVPSNRARVTIDPCQESVHVVVRNISNSTTAPAPFDHTYKDTETYPLHLSGLPDMMLKVSIDNYNFSMQMGMMLIIPNVTPLDIIPRQKIILDRSNCSNIKFYNTATTTTPSSGSNSQPSQSPPPNGHSQHQVSIAVVVGVPTGILMLLALTLLIAIIMVLALWRIRKRRRAYSFQRMTFTEIDDDDKE